MITDCVCVCVCVGGSFTGYDTNLEFIIILVINQLNAKNFIVSLLYACTCFKHYVLIIRNSLSTCVRDGHLQV